jgi:hypothetical protein
LQAGVADRATFVQQDLFESDFSKATVVTMFLLPDINRKLMPRLLSLKPGTRIVSNSFPIGDWTPDQSVILTAEWGARRRGARRCPGSSPRASSEPTRRRTASCRSTSRSRCSPERSRPRTATVPVEGRVVGEEVVLKAGERELRGRVVGGRVSIP